ncbi:MAG: protein translocase subunit SecF [Dehalococcoidia bacterium]|nr:protein translocase subunit SecF [Dehalococcoidia bacterium]
MIDFTGKKNWFFIGSVIPMVIGVIFIIVSGIPWGIDFTGGTTMTVQAWNQDNLKTWFEDEKHPEATVEELEGNTFAITTGMLTEEDQGRIERALQDKGLTISSIESVADGTLITVAVANAEALTRGTLETKLSDLGHSEATIQEGDGGKYYAETKELKGPDQDQVKAAFGRAGWTTTSLSSVSDPLSKERARNAIIGVVIASVAMLLYIWWAFRKVSNPLRYGTCAVVAMLHDIVICISFYVIFASALNLEVNLMFVTGILTVIGYSVNDTVVVFDRIRENLGKVNRSTRFEEVVNASLTETLTRCMITVSTTLIAAAAVWLFVGDPIRNLLMVLLVGIASGAYSSIFIASMLLVVWENRAEKRVEMKGAPVRATK